MASETSVPTTCSIPEKKGGFLYNYGPQAWIDWFMSHQMIVKKGSPLLPYTFVPILKMTTDPDRIERDGWTMQAAALHRGQSGEEE